MIFADKTVIFSESWEQVEEMLERQSVLWGEGESKLREAKQSTVMLVA